MWCSVVEGVESQFHVLVGHGEVQRRETAAYQMVEEILTLGSDNYFILCWWDS